MERYEEALADYNQAIALDEKNIQALIGRAVIYRRQERYEEALADYDRAIALDKAMVDNIYMTRGLLFSYLGRYAEAIECYEFELKKNSDNYRALYNIAVVMVRWKELSAAQTYIERARSALLTIIDADQRGATFYGLGGLEALVHNTDQALNYLQKAIPLEKEAIDWARHDVAWLEMRTNLRFRSLISETE